MDKSGIGLQINKNDFKVSFSEELVWQVWSKAFVVSISDALTWRKDECGAWIERREHGNRDSQYGWEIDHIKSVPKGGTDDISNLRPLHWKNNVRRHDGSLKCPITAAGTENVRQMNLES